MAEMAMPDSSELCLVIGAGPSGLCVASAYKKAGLKGRLLVLDSADAVGGWSCQLGAAPFAPGPYNALGFSDSHVHLSPVATAQDVQRYLAAYAAHHGIVEHVRTGCRLTHLGREPPTPPPAAPAAGDLQQPRGQQQQQGQQQSGGGGRWLASFTDLSSGQQHTLTANYVVLATGWGEEAALVTSADATHHETGLGEVPACGPAGSRRMHVHAATSRDLLASGGVTVIGDGAAAYDAASAAALLLRGKDVRLVTPTVEELQQQQQQQQHAAKSKVINGASLLDSARARALAASLQPHYTAPKPGALGRAVLAPTKRRFWAALKGRLAFGSRGRDDSSEVHGDAPREGAPLVLWAPSLRDPRFMPFLDGALRRQLMGGGGERGGGDGGGRDGGDGELVLYRGVLHPDVRGLAFVGLEAHASSSLLLLELQAQWLVAHLAAQLALPPPAAMRADVAAQRAWRSAALACPLMSAHGSLAREHERHALQQLRDDFRALPAALPASLRHGPNAIDTVAGRGSNNGATAGTATLSLKRSSSSGLVQKLSGRLFGSRDGHINSHTHISSGSNAADADSVTSGGLHKQQQAGRGQSSLAAPHESAPLPQLEPHPASGTFTLSAASLSAEQMAPARALNNLAIDRIGSGGVSGGGGGCGGGGAGSGGGGGAVSSGAALLTSAIASPRAAVAPCLSAQASRTSLNGVNLYDNSLYGSGPEPARHGPGAGSAVADRPETGGLLPLQPPPLPLLSLTTMNSQAAVATASSFPEGRTAPASPTIAAAAAAAAAAAQSAATAGVAVIADGFNRGGFIDAASRAPTTPRTKHRWAPRRSMSVPEGFETGARTGDLLFEAAAAATTPFLDERGTPASGGGGDRVARRLAPQRQASVSGGGRGGGGAQSISLQRQLQEQQLLLSSSAALIRSPQSPRSAGGAVDALESQIAALRSHLLNPAAVPFPSVAEEESLVNMAGSGTDGQKALHRISRGAGVAGAGPPSASSPLPVPQRSQSGRGTPPQQASPPHFGRGSWGTVAAAAAGGVASYVQSQLARGSSGFGGASGGFARASASGASGASGGLPRVSGGGAGFALSPPTPRQRPSAPDLPALGEAAEEAEEAAALLLLQPTPALTVRTRVQQALLPPTTREQEGRRPPRRSKTVYSLSPTDATIAASAAFLLQPVGGGPEASPAATAAASMAGVGSPRMVVDALRAAFRPSTPSAAAAAAPPVPQSPRGLLFGALRRGPPRKTASMGPVDFRRTAATGAVGPVALPPPAAAAAARAAIAQAMMVTEGISNSRRIVGMPGNNISSGGSGGGGGDERPSPRGSAGTASGASPSGKGSGGFARAAAAAEAAATSSSPHGPWPAARGGMTGGSSSGHSRRSQVTPVDGGSGGGGVEPPPSWALANVLGGGSGSGGGGGGSGSANACSAAALVMAGSGSLGGGSGGGGDGNAALSPRGSGGGFFGIGGGAGGSSRHTSGAVGPAPWMSVPGSGDVSGGGGASASGRKAVRRRMSLANMLGMGMGMSGGGGGGASGGGSDNASGKCLGGLLGDAAEAAAMPYSKRMSSMGGAGAVGGGGGGGGAEGLGAAAAVAASAAAPTVRSAFASPHIQQQQQPRRDIGAGDRASAVVVLSTQLAAKTWCSHDTATNAAATCLRSPTFDLNDQWEDADVSGGGAAAAAAEMLGSDAAIMVTLGRLTTGRAPQVPTVAAPATASVAPPSPSDSSAGGGDGSNMGLLPAVCFSPFAEGTGPELHGDGLDPALVLAASPHAPPPPPPSSPALPPPAMLASPNSPLLAAPPTSPLGPRTSLQFPQLPQSPVQQQWAQRHTPWLLMARGARSPRSQDEEAAAAAAADDGGAAAACTNSEPLVKRSVGGGGGGGGGGEQPWSEWMAEGAVAAAATATAGGAGGAAGAAAALRRGPPRRSITLNPGIVSCGLPSRLSTPNLIIFTDGSSNGGVGAAPGAAGEGFGGFVGGGGCGRSSGGRASSGSGDLLQVQLSQPQLPQPQPPPLQPQTQMQMQMQQSLQTPMLIVDEELMAAARWSTSRRTSIAAAGSSPLPYRTSFDGMAGGGGGVGASGGASGSGMGGGGAAAAMGLGLGGGGGGSGGVAGGVGWGEERRGPAWAIRRAAEARQEQLVSEVSNRLREALLARRAGAHAPSVSSGTTLSVVREGQ